MKIIKVIGGLGNQLYQYAFYLSLKKSYNDVFLDTSAFASYALHNGFELEKIFQLNADYADKKIARELKGETFLWRIIRRLFKRTKPSYLRQEVVDADNLPKDCYLDGYWQDRFFDLTQLPHLRSALVFKTEVFSSNDQNKQLKYLFDTHYVVGLHVRRGDFLASQNVGHFEQLDKGYYAQAIQRVKERMRSEQPLSFLVFSDDIQWCRANLQQQEQTHYVDWNKGEDSYLDLQLMTHCQALVIPNSTFSLWAAFLNRNRNPIVVAPNYWKKADSEPFHLPTDWIRIENR